jgi:transcriptional regulator with XRE-family HTH domain
MTAVVSRERGSELDDYLRRALRDRGWNVPQFAEACDVSVGLAAKWVSENQRYRVRPSPASCLKIAQALGVDSDVILGLAGHRPQREGSVHDQVDARRQVVRDQLDRWLSAVGPDNEEFFWQHLKAQGDSTVDLIKRVGTAVNADAEDAVNAAVNARSKRGRRPKGDGNGQLRRRLRTSAPTLTDAHGHRRQLAAA